jgi:drug/metabolite transporter (DMT)-like permease
MTLPLHELAALGSATCWATTGLIAADAIRSLGAFWFNLIRQVFVTLCLAALVLASGSWIGLDSRSAALLALSGMVGILLGDTFNFAAVGRLGPRRAGAIFALNAPMAAILGWAILGESLEWRAALGIALTAGGVALAVLGRTRTDAHRLEQLKGTLAAGALFGLGAALGQASGSLIARPVMAGGIDPWLASLVRVGASGAAMSVLAALPGTPALPRPVTPAVWAMTLATAVIGLLLGMTLFLYALKGPETGIVATLSATSPVIILPLLWLRTRQMPRPMAWAGAALAVAGLWLIFTR